jgi:hypothetical protein
MSCPRFFALGGLKRVLWEATATNARSQHLRKLFRIDALITKRIIINQTWMQTESVVHVVCSTRLLVLDERLAAPDSWSGADLIGRTHSHYARVSAAARWETARDGAALLQNSRHSQAHTVVILCACIPSANKLIPSFATLLCILSPYSEFCINAEKQRTASILLPAWCRRLSFQNILWPLIAHFESKLKDIVRYYE